MKGFQPGRTAVALAIGVQRPGCSTLPRNRIVHRGASEGARRSRSTASRARDARQGRCHAAPEADSIVAAAVDGLKFVLCVCAHGNGARDREAAWREQELAAPIVLRGRDVDGDIEAPPAERRRNRMLGNVVRVLIADDLTRARTRGQSNAQTVS